MEASWTTKNLIEFILKKEGKIQKMYVATYLNTFNIQKKLSLTHTYRRLEFPENPNLQKCLQKTGKK